MKTYFSIGGSVFQRFFANAFFDPRSVKVGSTTYTFANNGESISVEADGEIDEDTFQSLGAGKLDTRLLDYQDVDGVPTDEFVIISLEGLADMYEKFFKRQGEKILVICNPAIETIVRGNSYLQERFSNAEYFKDRFDKILKFDELPFRESVQFKDYITQVNSKLQTTEGKYNSRLIEDVYELLEAVPKRDFNGKLTKESLSNTFNAFEEFGIKKFSKQSLLDVYGIKI